MLAYSHYRNVSKQTTRDDFPLLEQLPTANEDKFPLLIQSDATAEELCAGANEQQVVSELAEKLRSTKELHSINILFTLNLSIYSEVIEFGDSYEAPKEDAATASASDGSTKKKGWTVAVTTEDMQKRKNDVKARTTLLLSLSDEHQLRFRKYKTAQELWAKEQKHEQTLIDYRSDLDTMSLDDLYNHLKVYESKVQKKSESNFQNMFFISSAKNSSGKEEVNTANVPTASTNVSPASVNVRAVSISQDTSCAYIGKKISIQGTDVAGFDKSKVECFNCHKMGHFAREAPKIQDRGRRDNYRQGSKVKEQTPKSLMAIDGVGWDWSYMANEDENHAMVAEEEAPTEFALMAKTIAESEVFDNSLYSKNCKKNTKSLNSKITDLTEKLCDNKNMLFHYKAGLSQVEGRLAEFKKQEIKFCEKIRGLKLQVEFKTNRIESLTNELELLKKEKGELDTKLIGFQTASKNLDNLLESQRSDKNKEGLGYSVVPPLPAQVYSPLKKDMSWIGLPEFADDTITDYASLSPSVESNPNDLQSSSSSAFENGESTGSILSKPEIKFVRPADSLTVVKLDKKETVRKSYVKYAELYRKPTKRSNVRGNQRNWNNLKSQQLGNNFVMKKACYNCSGIDHLSYDCGKRVDHRSSWGKNNNTHKSKTPRIVFHKTGRPPMRTNRPYMNGNSQNHIGDKGYWDSGCSQHMTGNISYLSDYEAFDGGYVSFSQGGCKITCKGTIKIDKLEFENVYFVKDLEDFKLIDDTNVLLRTPRQHNMYSINLNNIIPHKDLTCLVAKASADECMLWHKRLGKQHKASCKSKLVNSVTEPLHTLHMDLFGPTSDETSGILRKFITKIEKLKDLKVKIIRCDNGREFRNKEINDFCSRKGNKREFSNARTPQQNGVAEKRNRTLIEAARTITPTIGFLKPFGYHVMILNTLDNLGKFEVKRDEGYFISTKDAASQEVKKDVSFLRYIALPNWVHDALLESISSNAQDTCKADALESSGNLNPTASTTNPLADQMETLNDIRLISKRVTNQEETPSLDNILTLTNMFEDIIRVTTNSDDLNGVEADVSNMETTITASPISTLGIHKDHPKSQIIGHVDTSIQTKHKSKEDPEFPARVYKVEEAMYGLHQAPRASYGTLSKYLLTNGFQRGELNFFLGLQVLQKEDGIFLSQDKYVGDILKKFGYSDVRSSNTLMDKENPWGKKGTGKDVDLHLYRSMIGSLMYLTASRPDIMFVVCACARHQTIMATSTTDAEYVAAASGCGHVLWIQNQLLDYWSSMPCAALLKEISSSILLLIETTEEGTKILATVDGKLRTVSESSIRRNLKVNDEAGISSLSDAELFENLTLMGYNISPNQKFTFQKGQFSCQWKYLIHTIMQCLSLKRMTVKGGACPTDSGLDADQDRANIPKTSTLPSDSTPRVTSLATDEGSMQQKLNELMALCTSLQRQQLEMVSKFKAQELEINSLKARIKLLEDKDRGVVKQSGDDALIKGRKLDEREEVAERVSDDTEEMATVLTSIDAAKSTPYTRRKGKETMVESETPKKKKAREQIDVQLARELEEEMARDAHRMNEQIARDVEIARIHAEEELQMLIDGLDRNNETVDKYLQEYYQFATELPIEIRIELISDLFQDFIPIDSKEEAERFKKKGLRLEQESVKKLKTSEEVKATEEVPEEKVKEMMQLVPIEEVYVEALQVKHLIIDWKHFDREDLNQLWGLVKETLSIRPATSDKEMELWVDLKRLYEPDVKDQLRIHTQNLMHAPVEWKLYDTCGVHHVMAKDQDIFMLIEKDYPLRKGLEIVMISYNLQVENYSQMANDLILKIYKIANCLRQQDD
uniref:Integrase catalytic domain-containing protein n=1 Tax=Tanacetum cinerariifolium TaxID=118510 RepID=A0A6L2NKS1_TANCI|nr:hypothetical protein [Tanacetum cinerariifolium]